jgi:starch synthase
MPSRYEPSGLNQMYSLKYGTVPIVRATGGLDDSIEPFDLEHGTGTGFKFKEYSGEALLYAVRQGLHHYMDERIWKRIQLNGMAKDFSWKGPAAEYAKLYEAARASRGLEASAPIAGGASPGAGQASRGARQTTQGSGQALGNQKPVATSN